MIAIGAFTLRHVVIPQHDNLRTGITHTYKKGKSYSDASQAYDGMYQGYTQNKTSARARALVQGYLRQTIDRGPIVPNSSQRRRDKRLMRPRTEPQAQRVGSQYRPHRDRDVRVEWDRGPDTMTSGCYFGRCGAHRVADDFDPTHAQTAATAAAANATAAERAATFAALRAPAHSGARRGSFGVSTTATTAAMFAAVF
ncbi:hypothetical protein LTR17_020427 [Elasticomyces elasticus]|nr:hypothetical protein LTR17_020427 [Elasticomyces elasticus]